MNWDSKNVLEKGRQCIRVEAEALEATARSLDSSFADVIQRIEGTVASERKIIFTGVGKSAHVCLKLAGTFNSIGAPACFLDPTQALHGDLGLCAEGDLILLISNSGQTEELVRLLPMLKRFGLVTVVITGTPDSPLGKSCDHILAVHVPREACPLQLAPTASTTASMALGDALAMVYLEKRGFTRDDFARFHPSGALGMRLLLRVEDIMRRDDRFPALSENKTVREGILAMTQARAGCLAVTDGDGGTLLGVFTDGDFRRAALVGTNVLDQPLRAFMSPNPKTVAASAFAVDALKLFERHSINTLIVVREDGTPVGLVDNQDLPKLKLV